MGERDKKKLPNKYIWRMQIESKRNKKERMCGGILMYMRRNRSEEEKNEEVEGRMDCLIRRGKVRWRIVEIYVTGNLEKKMDGIKK